MATDGYYLLGCGCGGVPMTCNTAEEPPRFFYECSGCDHATGVSPTRGLAAVEWNQMISCAE